MQKSKSVLPRTDLALSYDRATKREKHKGEFTATGRDWAACIAAFGTSTTVIKSDQLATWANKATLKLNADKIAPDWTLQQHIDFLQIIGLCCSFMLIYASISMLSLALRYLIYDSPLLHWIGTAGRIASLAVRWLWTKLRTHLFKP